MKQAHALAPALLMFAAAVNVTSPAAPKPTEAFAVAAPEVDSEGQQARTESQAAQTGTIEFFARVTPTAGRAEPVRELTFYLLSRSLADIEKEVADSEPKPDLDKFIESRDVSKELKAWMKKKRSVELGGSEFIRRLKADDILEVPEFWEAYLRRNSGDKEVGFPSPKYRAQDAVQNPQKYEQLKEDFRRQVRRYIESNPQSIDGIDVHLDEINPGQHWAQQESEFRQRVHRRTFKVAQIRYLAAKADTDLDGRGLFTGLAPGEYWLGTLETEAVVGDARLRWDTPVTVRAGQLTRIELSNLNAIEPQRLSR